jgi:hypothetical protein
MADSGDDMGDEIGDVTDICEMFRVGLDVKFEEKFDDN